MRAKNPRLNFRSSDCSDCSHSKFGRDPQSHQISSENCPSSTGCCLIAVDFKLSKTINRIDYVQAVVLFPRLVKFSTILVNCKFNEGFKLSFLTLAWPFPTEGFTISGSREGKRGKLNYIIIAMLNMWESKHNRFYLF